MTDNATRAALWAIELDRLEPLGPRRGDYLLAETRGRGADLAGAMSIDASVVRERLERGCRAFVAESRAGAVAAWLWLSVEREWADPLRQELRFGSGECYGWNAGTLPQHRGRGLFTALLRYAGRRMAGEGQHTMWTGVHDDNLASQRGHLAAGFRPVLRLAAYHQPPPTRLLAWPADYADERLVERARRLLGDERLHVAEHAGEVRNGDLAALPVGRRS
ncbi:MAG: GNAT family N-acetyltransferase [Chloroflexi bacterium]|nr:MAG: GNAT family N-acetyltransferase [Chloroflexota bacterium]